MLDHTLVLSEQRGGVGIATLNAERSLNALTLAMIRALAAQLDGWAADPSIAVVVLRGAGEKDFCAGGDVRALRVSLLAQPGVAPNPDALAFFSEEYRLDLRIHTYPKPILLWGGGIVMGGGLGLMAGASHRVVTGTSRIAMPEITLGLYPDVGGSWFLPRMPGRSGLFLALTGASLNASDALMVGLADFFVQASDYEVLLTRLVDCNWSTQAAGNHVLLSKALRHQSAAATATRPVSNVQRHAEAIQQLTDGDTLEEVFALIAAYTGDDAWLKKAAAALVAGSPTSAALIWAIFKRAKHMSLAEVFAMELTVSLQCCAHPDFAEGVRALLVDKDQRPQWTPSTLAGVTPEWVEGHFLVP